MLRLWDTTENKMPRSPRKVPGGGPVILRDVMRVGFSPDGRWAIALDKKEGNSVLWNLEDNSLAGSPSYRDAVAGTVLRKGLGVVQCTEQAQICQWTINREYRFSPDADRYEGILSMGSLSSEPSVLLGRANGKLSLFHLQEMNEGQAIGTQQGPVNHIVVSDDDAFALTGSDDGTVTMWDLKTKKKRKEFTHGAAVTSVGISKDGRVGISGGRDAKVRLWNLPKS